MKPKRIIAIGDIHGELDKLNLLLDWVSPTEDDQLVFLGDYIDRGRSSCGVIERLLSFRQGFPTTIFLRGNHEQMLLDALEEEKGKTHTDPSERKGLRLYNSTLEMFLGNGGKETLHSYGVISVEDIPEDHIDFMASTTSWWVYENFTFVHAGLEPNVPLEEQYKFTLLWARNSPPGKNGKIHVVGHTPTPDGEPRLEAGLYSLDTGAVYGRSLTACDVLTKEVWQI